MGVGEGVFVCICACMRACMCLCVWVIASDFKQMTDVSMHQSTCQAERHLKRLDAYGVVLWAWPTVGEDQGSEPPYHSWSPAPWRCGPVDVWWTMWQTFPVRQHNNKHFSHRSWHSCHSWSLALHACRRLVDNDNVTNVSGKATQQSLFIQIMTLAAWFEPVNSPAVENRHFFFLSRWN